MTVAGRVGLRVRTDVERAPQDVIDKLRRYPSASIADAMGRFQFMDSGIVNRSDVPMAGPAVTVSVRPGDNLLVHYALAMAQPGDIVVVSTGGNTENAVFGELMCHAASQKKLGGIVIDGALRDVHGIVALRFPAFSRTVCVGSCEKNGPGEMNVPVVCGGIVVQPGDAVLGDDEGVVVVPRTSLHETLEAVEQVREYEKARLDDIQRGAILDPNLADRLRALGLR